MSTNTVRKLNRGRNRMTLFYPTGGSVWRRDFRRRMVRHLLDLVTPLNCRRTGFLKSVKHPPGSVTFQSCLD